jgi:chaperonin GroES
MRQAPFTNAKIVSPSRISAEQLVPGRDIRNGRGPIADAPAGHDLVTTRPYCGRRHRIAVDGQDFFRFPLLTLPANGPYEARWHSPPGSANKHKFIGSRGKPEGLAGIGPDMSSATSAPLSKGKAIHMAFRPLHDRVLVRRIEAEAKTAGGIIIPDTAKEKPQEGEIVSVGSGTKAEDGKVTPLDVKAGDKILFGKWSGTEVKVDGEDLIIMKESDILGIVG